MSMWGKKTQPDKVNTIIGAGTVFEGKLASTSSIRVDGEIIGEIKTEGNVLIGKDGKVVGDIHAANVTIEGRIEGNVLASSSVYIIGTGYIQGDISTETLEIERGAVFNGQSVMQSKHVQPKSKAKPETATKASEAS